MFNFLFPFIDIVAFKKKKISIEFEVWKYICSYKLLLQNSLQGNFFFFFKSNRRIEKHKLKSFIFLFLINKKFN